MIKNLCIVILTLAVIVLFWMSFSGRSIRAHVADLGQKALEIKMRLQEPSSDITQGEDKTVDHQGVINHALFQKGPESEKGKEKGRDKLSKRNRLTIFKDDATGKRLFDYDDEAKLFDETKPVNEASPFNEANLFNGAKPFNGTKLFEVKIENKVYRKPVQETTKGPKANLKAKRAANRAKKKRSDDLTTQDIISILSILKAAQSLTRKSALGYPEKLKGTPPVDNTVPRVDLDAASPADNTGPEGDSDAAGIKKKLSIGLAELEE